MNWGLLATALLASAAPLRPAARASDAAASEKRGTTEAAATGGEAKAPTASGGEPVRQAKALPMGSIDRDGVREVIQSHADEIRACYEAALEEDAGLNGKVVLKWVIRADGSVASPIVEASSTTLRSDKLLECMLSRVKGWTFPKPEGGGIAVITYPWILRASAAAPAEAP